MLYEYEQLVWITMHALFCSPTFDEDVLRRDSQTKDSIKARQRGR